jgi:hypothetical protein
MGPLRTAIKEACEKTFSIVKFLCVIHVTKNYLIDPVMVSMVSLLTYHKFVFMINNN